MRMNELEKEIRYKQEYFAQKTPYLQWLKQQEAELCRRYAGQGGGHKRDSGKQIHTLPFSSCMDSVQGFCDSHARGICLFVKEGGSLSEYAYDVVGEIFSEQPDTLLFYADEDYRGSLEKLYDIREGFFDDGEYVGAPWFKPDFSPDTLASFFYVGSVFAVKGKTIQAMLLKYGRGISIYELVYRIFMDALAQGRGVSIVHVPKVLYTNNTLDESRRLDSLKRIRELYAEEASVINEDLQNDKVSIVIPSKDNAEVLGKCLETLIKYTSYPNYEIIIVDNGSNPGQKLQITDEIKTLQDEYGGIEIKYIYNKMTFNFSAMCNMGAEAAEGGYLLFLNDDIEVTDTENGTEWLGCMMDYAVKKHVGAVGAKLYYPAGKTNNGCYKIQHAGITNMGIGPAHKLGGLADEGCMYHGHNTMNYDMLAVTAACMLVRRGVFEKAGGFDEGFAVAYNDVELCFRLYKAGYYNVQVNDAVLIHHESLSRGQDTSPEKMARLECEKQRLYDRYPCLKAKDPFYSPNLVQWKRDVQYNTGYLYGADRPAEPVLLENNSENGERKHAVFKKHDFRNMLKIKSGFASKVYDRLTGYYGMMLNIDSVTYDISNITIQGWFVVRNTDNADIPKKLWLINETRNTGFRTVYELDIMPKLREDAAALFDGDGRTKNTALSGIQVIFQKKDIKPGNYCIGVVCRGRLLCDLEKQVKINRD